MTPKPSERELCENFAATAAEQNWTVYPETFGWDLLIVRDGVQVGVQAKRTANLAVVAQALPQAWRLGKEPDPDHRAVLVPAITRDLVDVARAAGLATFGFILHRTTVRYDTRPNWIAAALENAKRWERSGPYVLPDAPPPLPAGVPAPRQLTAWRIKAIRLCAKLRTAGVLTTADFKAEKISPRLWLSRDRGWLVPLRRGVYGPGTGTLPDVGYVAEVPNA